MCCPSIRRRQHSAHRICSLEPPSKPSGRLANVRGPVVLVDRGGHWLMMTHDIAMIADTQRVLVQHQPPLGLCPSGRSTVIAV